MQEACFSPDEPLCEQEKQLALYLRYQTTHERAFERCAGDLRRLREEREQREKAKIGFESQKRKEADETRKQELHQGAVLLAEAKVEHQQVLTLGVRLPITMAQIAEEDRKKVQKAA